MRKTVFVIICFTLIAVLIMPNPRRFDFLNGEYTIMHFSKMGQPIKSTEQQVLKIDNLSDWLNIYDMFRGGNVTHENTMIGKYDFDENDGKFTMSLSRSNPTYLNGEYQISIDTIEFNKHRQTFTITFESKTVKIVGYKQTIFLQF